MQKKIYFRADGNARMGLGHVFRSLALLQMLQEEFDCHFVIKNPRPELLQVIQPICSSIIKLEEFERIEDEAAHLSQHIIDYEDIVVLDGYHFKTAYQQIIKDRGCSLVCIDDIHDYPFVADVVINHAPGLTTEYYELTVDTRACLGLDYALLRPAFLEAAKRERSFSEIKNIFICFGGSDYHNLTLKSLKGLLPFSQKINQVNVVTGAAYQYREELEFFQKNNSELLVRTLSNLSADEMVEQMRDSHLAIVPASSILYEAIAVGMPVISGYYVDNQVNVFKGFDHLNII